jgi:hypothetical protein
VYTAKGNKNCHEGKRERATRADDSQRVSDGVRKHSAQYKGYNLIGFATVEGGTTRGMTALVHYWIHSSIQVLFKGDAVHLTGLTVYQGRRQLSTLYLIFTTIDISTFWEL